MRRRYVSSSIPIPNGKAIGMVSILRKKADEITEHTARIHGKKAWKKMIDTLWLILYYMNIVVLSKGGA